MHQLRVKAVLFDAVGTLFHLRAPVGEIYLDWGRRHGLETRDPDLSRKLSDSFRRALAGQKPLAFPGEPAERVPQLEREWWKAVVAATFSDHEQPVDFDAFFDDVYEMFRTAEGWRLDADTGQVLRTVRGRGLKIGLVTNYDSRVLDVVRALGIDSLFDQITVSTLAGAAKPEPAIFRHACAGLSCRPAQVVHVGDDYEEDWRGARRAGLGAVLVDPNGRYRDRNVSRICRLAELLEILL